MITTHYKVEWLDPGKGWQNSWSWTAPMSLDQARARLREDQCYFYKRIHMRLVKITEEIIEETTGQQ